MDAKLLAVIGIAVLGIGYLAVFGFSSSPIIPGQPTSGIRVCYKNIDGSESCDITKELAIVNFEGKVYSSFHPYIRITSNIGSHTVSLNYRVDVHGNSTVSRNLVSDAVEATTPYYKELSIDADDVEGALDSLNVKGGSIIFSYVYGVKESKEVKTGSSAVSNIKKLAVQADAGIGGGTAATAPVSTTSTAQGDFQKQTCTIPYYYYSSSGIPRQCSSITSISVNSDKTVSVTITASVSNSPNTYGRAGGDIQLRVLDAKGDLVWAGQCQTNYCYIAGTKDYPNYALPSGVLVGENRAYSESLIDTLSPRRLGGANEFIIFDKATYSILLVEDGQQVAKKTFAVN